MSNGPIEDQVHHHPADDDIGDVIRYIPIRCGEGSEEGRSRIKTNDQNAIHGECMIDPPRRSNRISKPTQRALEYAVHPVASTTQTESKKRKRTPHTLPATKDNALFEWDELSSPLSSPIKRSEQDLMIPEGRHRRRITTSIKVADSKPLRTSYSGWSCHTAPPDILSSLRFDRAPELLTLPSSSAVEESYKAAQGSQSRHPNDGARSRMTRRRPIQREQTALFARDQVAVTAKKDGFKRQAIEKDQNEVQILPLPQTPFQPYPELADGIRSSRLCKVLRILAGLRSPRSRRTEVLPQPRNRPPVWAESRQELCEALPYYRSFQSGLYMHKKVAYGYLLEAFPAPRDIWAHNGKVIISHGGGQCVRTLKPDGTSGPATLQADQSRSDARVDTLLLAHEKRIPMVLIAGKGYEGLPWELNCAYVILGWYWISLTWVEAEWPPLGVSPPKERDYFHRVKIRFDWVESQGTPWWIESYKMTPLPSEGDEISCKDIQDDVNLPKDVPCCDEEKRTNDDLCTPKKMDVSSLLNPTGLPTPPHSSPGTQGHLNRSSPPSPCTSTTHRQLWPGNQFLSTAQPLLTFTEHSLNRSQFPSPTICPSCHRPIVRIYQEGLFCFQPECQAFFMLDSPIGVLPIPPGFSLSYDENFLKPRCTPPEVMIPHSVVPQEPVRVVLETEEKDGEVGGRTLWRGWVCRRCGRANCRYRWEVWECRNCGNTLGVVDPSRIILKKDLPHIPPSFLGDSKIDPSSGITSKMRWISEIGGTCMVSDLPHAGKVYHLIQPDYNLADELLQDYQKAANEGGWFQRRPLKGVSTVYIHICQYGYSRHSHAKRFRLQRVVKGQFLAQHFAVNFGAAYKYQVDTLSYPFEKSPECVTRSLDLIKDRVRLILSEEIVFNEILSVMYREGQKMSWHDDGEADLGPVVSSLSLGNQAIMSFRLKTPRVNPNQTYYKGMADREIKKISPTALSFTLSHGDIMIMQGSGIQKKYDHKVIPMGFRIASTARVIGVPEI
ncbi:hypothetical protein I204_03685 [Kwoniella mangroviensis CBS 8886]|nr:hypothetical protein I204_03685 [Kwoniella mangroviensis CBS 8886]